jgi:hypothetical protein
MPNSQPGCESEAMRRREITLPDGRYMIFYTFGEEMEKENGAPLKWEPDPPSSPLGKPSKPEGE